MMTKRLLKLADFLDTLPRQKFNFDRIAEQSGKPMLAALLTGKTRCGTVACAIGWMPAVFPRHLKWSSADELRPDVHLRADEAMTDFDAASVFFDIAIEEADFLFTPGSLDNGWSGLPGHATPKRVARHIRAFVRKRGGHVAPNGEGG